MLRLAAQVFVPAICVVSPQPLLWETVWPEQIVSGLGGGVGVHALQTPPLHP